MLLDEEDGKPGKNIFLQNVLKEHKLWALGYLAQPFLFSLYVSLSASSVFLLPEQEDKNIKLFLGISSKQMIYFLR